MPSKGRYYFLSS